MYVAKDRSVTKARTDTGKNDDIGQRSWEWVCAGIIRRSGKARRVVRSFLRKRARQNSISKSWRWRSVSGARLISGSTTAFGSYYSIIFFSFNSQFCFYYSFCILLSLCPNIWPTSQSSHVCLVFVLVSLSTEMSTFTACKNIVLEATDSSQLSYDDGQSGIKGSFSCKWVKKSIFFFIIIRLHMHSEIRM